MKRNCEGCGLYCFEVKVGNSRLAVANEAIGDALAGLADVST